jgi:probable phosphoglycerate mutase
VPTQITLLRHGEVHNPANVYYGRKPRFGLSERGREQSRAAGRALRQLNVAALYGSPLLRARQTCALIVALNPGLPHHTSRLLLEVHSPFDGQPNSELSRRGWDLYRGVAPAYEQPPDVLERVRRFFAHMRRRHAGQHVAAVTHGDLVAFSLLWACGKPITAMGRRQLPTCGVAEGYPAPASLSTFTFYTEAADEIPSSAYRTPY